MTTEKQLAVKACTVAMVAGVAGVFAACASEVELKWTLENGGVEKESRALAEKDGVLSLRLSKAEIKAKCAKRLELVPDFARAKKGEDGFWVLPKGQYGTFRCDDGSCGIGTPAMSMFGMKTPRCAFVAIVKGLKYYFGANVIAKNGEYAMNCVLGDELCRDPYEDFEIGFHMLDGKDATLGGMARVYRNYQLERGAVRPLKERIKGNDTLKYAVESLEIRIRQAWKPVPSPVPDQVPENEPAIKRVAVTFDRVGDIVRELKRQGVGKAELCLVGWNVGGHDGRWPQSFPVEEKLGGEAKLRQCIKDALDAGYLIVPHGNYRDAYRIADNWDIEYLIKDENGDPVQAHPVFWGGGRQFQVCPRRAYEFWASREMPRMAALGFKGIAYFDCITLLPAPVCSDPRHPLNRAESARFWGKSAEMSCKCFGGFSSEGPVDHAAGFLDSVLNASGGLNPAMKNSGLVDRVVPMWQLVYNGIITGNPFATTINFTTQSPLHRLKMLEFGGRPWFYFYSKFVDDGTDWMGEHDLGCATDEELAKSVAKIKAGWDIYSKVNRLQFEYMREHEQLAPDVFLTTWEDGTRIVTNYGSTPYIFEGRTVPPEDYLVADYPAPYAADASTPEKRAELTERLWAHDVSTDVRIWPEERLKPGAVEKPLRFTEKELHQSNLVIGDILNPQFSFFPARGAAPRPAVVVFPGGGYRVLGWNKEGTEVAKWFNAQGFSAFVLLYRTNDRDGALADAQRTMGIIRRDAAKYGIDPKRLGVIGFSAGANLAVRLSTNWRERRYARVDEADDYSCRPDFMMPIYPWDLRPRKNPAAPREGWLKTLDMLPEYPVDSETPPSFTVQAKDDFCEIETALALDEALRKAGVSSTVRIYPDGGHGYGLRRLGKSTDAWSDEAAAWLSQF